MEQNLEVPLPLEEVASRVEVSVRQLQRLFEQELNMTPRQWYLQLRIKRARRLLAETDLAVLAVGLACGFSSSSSFARSFRMYYGYSPRQVREENV